MNLNGLNQAMTFIHTGDNVTFLQATRKLDTFEIQQTKIYDLPYQYNGHAIKTLPDLIKHVYANYVDPKKTSSHYLALYSTRYNYEMTFVATPKGGAKKDFKDYLYYNLTKSYNLKLEESIVDWSLNDKYENNAVVCYSALGGTVQNDYTNLTAAGIQPRYSTAFPKILHNIYSYGAGTTGSGNALMIYIDERRTIDNTMTALRSLVEELKIGLILVSHLKRPDGNKGHENGIEVSLSHLRGSNSIGQLSDCVIALERNQQSDDELEARTTKLRVLKSRYTGDVGLASSLVYDKDTGRLSEEDISEFEVEEDAISI